MPRPGRGLTSVLVAFWTAQVLFLGKLRFWRFLCTQLLALTYLSICAVACAEVTVCHILWHTVQDILRQSVEGLWAGIEDSSHTFVFLPLPHATYWFLLHNQYIQLILFWFDAFHKMFHFSWWGAWRAFRTTKWGFVGFQSQSPNNTYDTCGMLVAVFGLWTWLLLDVAGDIWWFLDPSFQLTESRTFWPLAFLPFALRTSG